MPAIHSQTIAEIQWKAKQMKLFFDKKCEDAPSLEEGDRVYLRRRTKEFNIKSGNGSDKLEKLMLGAFRIKRKLENDNYELWLSENSRLHPVFHISLLKPMKNETNKNEDTEIFEVEKITGKKKIKGRLCYRIKWKDYEEETWEPEKTLNCHQLLEEFEERLDESARKVNSTERTKHTQQSIRNV